MASRRDLLLPSNLPPEPDENDDDFSQSSDEDLAPLENDFFLTAMDDLEGRIVSALDTYKLHTGVRRQSSNNTATATTIHDELKEILRPVLEIAAHSGPALARRYASFRSSVDRAMEEVYTRLNSDLILPVLLECAQTDMIPAKRSAALNFFHDLYREYLSSGSFLADDISLYGAFSASSTSSSSQVPSAASTAAAHALASRQRANQRSFRTAELLRYWIEASSSCTVLGAFTDQKSDGAIASRAVVSAGAVIRPALKHIAEKISSADDAGAMKLYLPLMKMMGGVLRRLLSFDSSDATMAKREKMEDRMSMDALRSSCIKFLEIIVLSFATRLQPGTSRVKQRNMATVGDDFAIDDLPMGHPVITRGALEEIGEDSFTVLKGLLLVGGQIKTDSAVIRDVMLGLGMEASGLSPSAHVVAVVRPAALSFIELQSSMRQSISDENPFPSLDRNSLDYDFLLSQKSYSLVINAISIIAVNRPIFYKESATSLTWRTMDPPSMNEPAIANGMMTKPGVATIQSHLKASCLTLLRNTLSVSSGESISSLLLSALSSDLVGMKVQAEKALRMASQNAALKTAGRAARNRANMFYEWDQSKTTATTDDHEFIPTELEDIDKKRQRAGDDAVERLRLARAARGLGNGIQLPASMTDCMELILVNLTHLPSNRATLVVGDKRQNPDLQTSEAKRVKAFSLDSLIDMVTTNGASLIRNESRWYARDGGEFWNMDSTAMVSDDEQDEGDDDVSRPTKSRKETHGPIRFGIDRKIFKAVSSTMVDGTEVEDSKVFKEECKSAASDAFQRIVRKSNTSRDASVADFGNRIAARLAWTLKGVQPSSDLRETRETALAGIMSTSSKVAEGDDVSLSNASIPLYQKNSMVRLAEEFPLVPACLTFEFLAGSRNLSNSRTHSLNNIDRSNLSFGASQSLVNRTMSEAYRLASHEWAFGGVDESSEDCTFDTFDLSLEIYLSSLLHICERADENPSDIELKKAASLASTSLVHQIAIIPAMTPCSLKIICSLCDIEGVTRKATEATKKSANRSLASSAAAHVAKVAAEKRATTILLILRDVAFQRSEASLRREAVHCAVGIAAGRLPSTASIEEKALKLVMNVIYPKNDDMADEVVGAATKELDSAASFAASHHLKVVEEANRQAESEQKSPPLLHSSDEEKAALDRVRKPVVLYMALCVRRPDMIKYLLELSSQSQDNANLLSKAVRNNMAKLTRAATAKYDTAKIALLVANQVSAKEIPMLLSFLDNLCPPDSSMPTLDLIEACNSIQDRFSQPDGKRDARFIIPIVSGMKRHDLQRKLCDFVAADDNVFKAALYRMSERVTRYALICREESENLHGMSLCEQLVFLHNLDFVSANIPQKRYIDAIGLCLDDVEIFTDRVVMATLDHISNAYLRGDALLPLAYMRSIILTCSKHESLHSWICHTLLPRLIDGKVYNDKRNWEGWMRCANMLEHTAESGVSSIDIIQKLPVEQYQQYRTKYPL